MAAAHLSVVDQAAEARRAAGNARREAERLVRNAPRLAREAKEAAEREAARIAFREGAAADSALFDRCEKNLGRKGNAW